MERGELISADQIAITSYSRFERKDPTWANRFRMLQGEIVLRQGHSKEALTLFDQPLPATLANDDVAVRRLIYQGVAHFRLQELPESRRLLEEAEQLANGKSPQLRAEVAINRGTTFAFENDFEAAKRKYRHALELATQSNETYLQSNALGGLGLASLRQQHYDEAIDWFTSSLRLADSLDNEPLEAATLGNLGWCYYKLGDLDRAEDLFQKAASIVERRGMLAQQQIWSDNLGLITYDRGNLVKAESYFKRSLAISRTIQNQEAVATALKNLSGVAIDTEQLQTAEAYDSQAVDLYSKTANREGRLDCLENEARIALSRKDYDGAKNYLTEIIANTQDVFLRWSSESDLAVVYASQGRHADADREFQRGLATIDEARSSLNVEEHRLSFLTSASRFYNSYIDFLVEHGRVNDALRIAEHSRARTLAEGLGISPSREAATEHIPTDQVRVSGLGGRPGTSSPR